MAVNNSQHALSATERSPLLSPRSTSEPTGLGTESEDLKDDTNRRLSFRRAACILVTLAFTIILQASNFTLMTTIQGSVADDIDAYAEVSWFTSVFLIANSGMTPLYGRFAQIFTPRQCLLATSIIFAIGALIASQARSLSIFLLGRSLQGVGGSVWVLTTIIVIDLTSKERRGLFIGLANATLTLGVSVGAVLSGALLEPIGWRALFWIQCPLSLVAGTAVFLALPRKGSGTQQEDESTIKQKLWRIDYSGVFLLMLSIVSGLIGLSSPKVLPLPIVLGVAIFIVFLINEIYRAEDPIIPVLVLKSRGVLLSCGSQLVLMIVRWTVLLYIPIYVQAVRLWSSAAAGAILVPTNAGLAVGGLITGALHIRRGGSFYIPTLICFAAFSLAMLAISRLATATLPIWAFVLAIFVNGFAVGSIFNYAFAHMLHLVEPEVHFVSTSLLVTFRVFSGTIGASIGGGLFARMLEANLKAGFAEHKATGRDELVRQLLGKPGLVRDLTGIDHLVARQGYQEAIQGFFLAGCGLSLLAILLQAGTGWTPPNHTQDKPRSDDDEETQ